MAPLNLKSPGNTPGLTVLICKCHSNYYQLQMRYINH